MSDTITITAEERAELRKLAEEATPRPWTMVNNCAESDHMEVKDSRGVVCETPLYGFEYPEQWRNGAYIALACNIAPRLLDALETSEARVTELENSLTAAINKQAQMADGIDKIAAANHALEDNAQKAEAEVARLRKRLESALDKIAEIQDEWESEGVCHACGICAGIPYEWQPTDDHCCRVILDLWSNGEPLPWEAARKAVAGEGK